MNILILISILINKFVKIQYKDDVSPPSDEQHKDDLYNEANDNAACEKNH